MTFKELDEEIAGLYKSLGPLDRGNAEGLMQDLDYSVQWLARSAELMAEAQAILSTSRGISAEKYEDRSATLMRELVNAGTANEQRLYVRVERLNAVLTHRIDSIRSLLSFEKASMTNLREQR